MTFLEKILPKLEQGPKTWVVTGAAGFIGSHLVETLLKLNQKVVGVDNFLTGHRSNLQNVHAQVGVRWGNFQFIEGDILDTAVCQKAFQGANFVLHQAALASVPRSLKHPDQTHKNNVDGFLNVLLAARNAGVQRLVYASSSSVYGDNPDLPKVEAKVGKVLSPYALSKKVNELYAENFAKCFGIQTVGLRYFNVFGPRQDPKGDYAAVIPRWIEGLVKGQRPTIFGDGETTRDFCYVGNAVQANLLAALSENPESLNRVYNVAVGEKTSLNTLFQSLVHLLQASRSLEYTDPQYQTFRDGDIRHSLADVTLARDLLGYEPETKVQEGLRQTVQWFLTQPI